MDLANCRFTKYTGKHAILISQSGTYNLSNCYFDKSGTAEIETTHATGTVTINISGGGTLPRVTRTGAGTFSLNNHVTISVNVIDTNGAALSGARVRVTTNEAKGSLASGAQVMAGLTNAQGVLSISTFNFEAAFGTSLGVNVRVRKSSSSPFYKNNDSVNAVTANGLSTTITMLGD